MVLGWPQISVCAVSRFSADFHAVSVELGTFITRFSVGRGVAGHRVEVSSRHALGSSRAQEYRSAADDCQHSRGSERKRTSHHRPSAFSSVIVAVLSIFCGIKLIFGLVTFAQTAAHTRKCVACNVECGQFPGKTAQEAVFVLSFTSISVLDVPLGWPGRRWWRAAKCARFWVHVHVCPPRTTQGVFTLKYTWTFINNCYYQQGTLWLLDWVRTQSVVPWGCGCCAWVMQVDCQHRSALSPFRSTNPLAR